MPVTTQDREDTFIEEAGKSVQGHGPGVSCDRCKRNSVLVGVWFWGYRAIASVALAADVDHWLCPPCATRNCRDGELKGIAVPKRQHAVVV